MTETITKLIIKRLEDLGRAKQMIESILEHEIFDNLSKHGSYWNPNEDQAFARLDEVRLTLSYIESRLWDLSNVLQGDQFNEQ